MEIDRCSLFVSLRQERESTASVSVAPTTACWVLCRKHSVPEGVSVGFLTSKPESGGRALAPGQGLWAERTKRTEEEA